MLELAHVAKHYQSPGELVHAVEDVSMNVSARELVALFGPSGSGKTTLLLLRPVCCGLMPALCVSTAPTSHR
jgi:ABC-type lipoprotein export system ATPase subunit